MSSDETRTPQERLDELTKRYRKLHEQKISAETTHRNAKQRLGELREEAREKYETDDIDKLKEKLTKMRSENDERIISYKKSLDKIESQLDKVKKGKELEDLE